MSDMVLNIWLEKNNNEYVRQRTKLKKDNLWDKQSIDIWEIPIVPEMIFPSRYKWESNVIIHGLFQERIEKQKKIQEESNQIDMSFKQRPLLKEDTTDQINNLKNQL